MSKEVSATKKSLSHSGVMILTLVAIMFASISAFGQAKILEVHDGLPDLDSRKGAIAPTTTQKNLVARMGAAVRWNRFGTPHSLIKYGGYLATGLSGNPSTAARNWIAANKALFRLSDLGVANLELVSDTKLTGTNAYVILFRQRFGDLTAAQDGMITVGIADGKVAYVSSSAVGDMTAPGPATLSATAAWIKAARDIGRTPLLGQLQKVRQEAGWTLFDAPGFSHPQRSRLVAFPTPTGVRPAFETIVLDVKGGQSIAYTHFIDAQTGAVLFRQNRVYRFAPAPIPSSTTFTGSFNPPTPGTCGAANGPYAAPVGTKTIDVVASADNPANDIVLNLYKGKPGAGGVIVGSSDTGTSPEAIHYEGSGGSVPAGQYWVQVCLFNDPTVGVVPPDTYTGNITINDAVGAQVVPYPPMWSFFTATPELSTTGAPNFNYPDTDNRILGCWEAKIAGTPVPGCDLELFNVGSRTPWDTDVKLNAPTFTTKGNNANSAEAWTAPLSPGAFGFRPTANDRKYNFPWTNAWENSKCDPTNFVPGVGNDISAAVTNLFAVHNRMHDWAYHLGFNERTWNLQENNFGNRASGGAVNNVNGGENDPETGQSQAGAVDGGAPSYLGRDNANQIALNDGVPGITNMYLWQPISSAFYGPCTDGDYDMSIVGHEYTHAISNRMVGGPDANLTGEQAGAMGEAWSDLAAVEYLNGWSATNPAPYDFPVDGENRYAVGPYATGNKERGIRDYPMNRNTVLPFAAATKENPLNYSDIGFDVTGPEVHADGEVWIAVNYELRQALVTKYQSQFKADDEALQRRCSDGILPADKCPGNRRWAQIMFDAWLLMQPGVSMLDARDAYLGADLLRFGGANQTDLWRVFAHRGMGEFAYSNGSDDGQPVPNFESKAGTAEAAIKFVVKDENGVAVKAQVFVGHYEARATQIADTDPNTKVNAADIKTKIFSDIALMVPGRYDFTVRANGYGHTRFTRTIHTATPATLVITMPTNFASKFKGASASGDGFFHANLIDDTEDLGWAANNRLPSVNGTKVTVDLAGGAHTINRVQVSALVSPDDPTTAPDSTDLPSGRFVALRQFEIWTCTAGANLLNPTCSNAIPAGFKKIYTSPASAFPGAAPRPVAPDLILRSFNVPSTTATHVQLRVVTNQCTGGPQFQGDQDNDPLNDSDCIGGSDSDNTVRVQELQVFGGAAVLPAMDPAVAVTMTGPATATRDSEISYEISYTNLGPAASSNAVVTDVLPEGLEFVSATGGTYDPATRKVTWKLGTVDVNAPGKLTLKVRVGSSLAAATTIINQAEYTADLTVATPAAAVTLVP